MYITPSGSPLLQVTRMILEPFPGVVVTPFKPIRIGFHPFLLGLFLPCFLTGWIKTGFLPLPYPGIRTKELSAKQTMVLSNVILELSAEKHQRKTKKTNRIKPHYFLTGIKTRNQKPRIKSLDLGPFELAPTQNTASPSQFPTVWPGLSTLLEM